MGHCRVDDRRPVGARVRPLRHLGAGPGGQTRAAHGHRLGGTSRQHHAPDRHPRSRRAGYRSRCAAPAPRARRPHESERLLARPARCDHRAGTDRDGRRCVRRAAQGEARRALCGHEGNIRGVSRSLHRPGVRHPGEGVRRRSPAEGLRVGDGRAGALAERRRHWPQGPALQAGGIRLHKEVSDGRVLLRAAERQPPPVCVALRPERDQPDALRVERLSHLRAGHRVRERLPGPERAQVDRPRRAVVDRAWFREGERDRIAGAELGRVSDGVHDHADEHVPRGDGWRAGREHDERVRRHPLGVGIGARVPVREGAEPYRRIDLAGAAALPRELAALLR